MKLVVEVVDAHDLMPKDGEGSASSFVEVDFENQLRRTKTIPKNLNPIWNQKLIFDFDQTKNHQAIEISVYNERKPISGRNFLGRVRFPCSNIVKKGEEAYHRFHLERKWFFSSVKGEIGLKIYLSPESSSSPPPPLNTPPISENTNLLSKTLAAVPKAEVAVISSSSSSTIAAVEPTGADPAKETQEIREPAEERAGRGQHIYKHQSLQQPGVPFTMRQGNPQAHPNLQEDYELKDTNPQLGERWPNGAGFGGRGWMSSERFTSTYDLVEQTFYLYVRVVKAKDLPPSSITGSCDPYVEVKLGNYKGRTRHFEKKMNPEWHQVFSFSKERIQSSVLEVFVKDKETVGRDDYLGRVVFDLNEIPTRVPPDSALAPQWYRLEDRRGQGKVRGEIMLAVWMGTQADEAFPESWNSDAAAVYGDGVFNIRSKVYVSPKLWYLRVNVIEAQDVLPNDRSRLPEVFVKAQVGNQVLKTKVLLNYHLSQKLQLIGND